MSTSTELSTHDGPILMGDIYCSRSCGCGCKKADYDQAVVSAQALADYVGGNWEPDVWENMGWHWAVKSGPHRISPNVRRLESGEQTVSLYTAYINSKPQFVASASDPLDAFRAALSHMQTCFDALRETLEDTNFSLPVIDQVRSFDIDAQKSSSA